MHINKKCLYLLDRPIENSMAHDMTRKLRDGGQIGSTLDDKLNSLQDELQNLHKRFDLHKQLMDLFVMDAIDKYKYVRISTTLTSVDKETVNMAEQIVVQLHTKWIRKTMEGRVIELPEVSSVGNNSLLTD